MDIVVMIGSLRKDSYHRKLFNYYREITSSDCQFTEILTSDFPLYNQDLEADKPKQIEIHAARLRKAAALMFFSPEYNYSLPGHLKNAIDWLSRCEPNPFSGKKTAIIGGSPGMIGSARMQYDLRKIGVYLNLQFLNKPEVMIGSMIQKFDAAAITDTKTMAFLQKHWQAFSDFIAS